jgi:dTDP-4-amino-4,6-dideoxygalactose transaminase
MQVPFNDLARQYASIKESLDTAIHNTLHQFRFVRGETVGQFEREFSQLLNVRHCIATGNGTDALFIILKALGIRAGDEVITPAFSWITSAETISLCGATPVFADVDPNTYTLDVESVRSRITSKTRAVVVVHLYGQAAHMGQLEVLCRERGLFLVEDCAQGHLTKEGNRYAGTFGTAAAFSFYPTKNLGAYGDAGCMVTSDDALAERVRRFANHGALIKDDHLFEGLNSRMDSLQAAVLLAKLPSLKSWNSKRLQHAQDYSEKLRLVPEITVPFIRPGTDHTFHLYVIRTKKRDALKAFLEERGVQSLIHYPLALHNLPAYHHLRYRSSDFPVAGNLQDEVLSLPIFAELTGDEINYVCENIREFFRK